MRLAKSLIGAFALAAMNTLSALAASAPHCVGESSDVCFSWAVPETAIQSGSGNVYFQINASTTYSYAALAIGTQMRGAEMFVLYQNGSDGVTLSTRAGTGHVMPQFQSRPGVQLLAGSGVIGKYMVANVLCRDCQSLDFGDDSPWISAWHAGDAIDSTSPAAPIKFHDGFTDFKINLRQAAIASDSNPFVDDNGRNKSPNSTSTNVLSGSGGGSSSGGGVSRSVIYSHGIIMMLVWAVMYPLGALLMPLIGAWILHAVFQMVAFIGMWAGLALGYIAANNLNLFWNNYHTRIGIIVCGLMALQPLLGLAHHMSFKKHGKRGSLSHLHVWYGRGLMIIGVIDGGLGIWLARSREPLKITYIVLATVVMGTYLVATPWIEHKKAKAAKNSHFYRGMPAVVDSGKRSPTAW